MLHLGFSWNSSYNLDKHCTKTYVRTSLGNLGRDPFNQNSNRSDREKWSTSKGGPVFSKLFRLDRTDPLSFGPKFPEILVEWIAPQESIAVVNRLLKRFYSFHSTKIPTGPTGKIGPPQKVDPFFRNFSGLTEPIYWVLDRNFRKFWLNGSRPFCFHTRKKKRRLGLAQSSPAILLSPNSFDS